MNEPESTTINSSGLRRTNTGAGARGAGRPRGLQPGLPGQAPRAPRAGRQGTNHRGRARLPGPTGARAGGQRKSPPPSVKRSAGGRGVRGCGRGSGRSRRPRAGRTGGREPSARGAAPARPRRSRPGLRAAAASPAPGPGSDERRGLRGRRASPCAESCRTLLTNCSRAEAMFPRAPRSERPAREGASLWGGRREPPEGQAAVTSLPQLKPREISAWEPVTVSVETVLLLAERGVSSSPFLTGLAGEPPPV